ncbi:hypothetical protein B0H15DRAFT_856498 [Mycena belliarum]|uniref:Uncharacterized protein n=1 Tax=Mycena belliarum TaxID=1033014 RepID=A0AAD6XI47_9AGAR|nr:hypothetical protein B0H15DRAFT_856498 [Mycena belliae]
MPTVEVDDSEIPEGFICVNSHLTELWSKVAFEHVERLQTEEEKRNPDAQGLYVYNDYFGYACCDLLKKEMLAIGKLVSNKTEKLSLATFHRLEALTLYMANSNGASVFPTIDDPELAEAIYEAYGALWLTYILSLEAAAKPQKLGPAHPLAIRNLENVVRTSAKVITQYSGLGFDKNPKDLQDAMLRVLERNDMDGTVKEKLFYGKSADSDEESDEDSDNESDNEAGESTSKRKSSADARPAKKPRKTSADDADVRAEAKAWKASAAMKALREAHGPVEHGGRPWDITKWSPAALAAERARFGGDDDDF